MSIQQWRANSPGKKIFIIGVAVAIVAAVKSPDPNSRWPNTLLPYAIAMISAAIGIWLWRNSERAAPQEASVGGKSALTTQVSSLLSKLRSLETLADKAQWTAFGREIEKVIQVDLNAAIEQLGDLDTRFSQAEAATLSSQFAFAERYLNRAWSAASDGSPEETKISLRTAIAGFQDLAQKIA